MTSTPVWCAEPRTALHWLCQGSAGHPVEVLGKSRRLPAEETRFLLAYATTKRLRGSKPVDVTAQLQPGAISNKLRRL